MFCLSNHLSVDIWVVSTFQITVNNVAMNTDACTPVQVPAFISFENIPRSGIDERRVLLFK